MVEKALAGTVSLVIGASEGIGKECAIWMGRRGANVALAARRPALLEAVAGEVQAEGVDALPVACDVRNYDEVVSAVDAVLARFGRLDSLIVSAGVVTPIGRIHETDPAQWAEAMRINTVGAYHTYHAVLPHLLKNRGVIVNVGSGAGSRPITAWGAYCTSKAGMAMLTRQLAHEYGEQGLRVYEYWPGMARTSMQVTIKASAANAISGVDPAILIPPEWPAQVISWFCTTAAADVPSGIHDVWNVELRERAGLTGVEIPLPPA